MTGDESEVNAANCHTFS